jgi:hypothetical protein
MGFLNQLLLHPIDMLPWLTGLVEEDSSCLHLK